jgi:hypothetical protein
VSRTVSCTLALLLSAATASAATASAATDDHRQLEAQWLTQQLHRPVEASQILVFLYRGPLEGCAITRARRESIGATSLSMRCPAPVLPQLVLLNLSLELDPASVSPSAHFAPPRPRSHGAPPIVRAGAVLAADWRTDSLHAQLPVIALDSGAAGAEIRVRVPQSNRIMRARILGAHTVAIIVAGA